VYFYVPGTTTPKDTYQDIDLTILNTNPVVLDSLGFGGHLRQRIYRQIVEDVNSVTVWDAVTATVGYSALLLNIVTTGKLGIGVAPGAYGVAVLQSNNSPAYFGSSGAFDANVTVDNAQGGHESNVLFDDAGAVKFTLGKSTANGFRLNHAGTGRDIVGSTSAGNLVIIPSGGTVPGTAAAAGTAGQMAWDGGFIYLCIAAIHGSVWLSPPGRAPMTHLINMIAEVSLVVISIATGLYIWKVGATAMTVRRRIAISGATLAGAAALVSACTPVINTVIEKAWPDHKPIQVLPDSVMTATDIHTQMTYKPR